MHAVLTTQPLVPISGTGPPRANHEHHHPAAGRSVCHIGPARSVSRRRLGLGAIALVGSLGSPAYADTPTMQPPTVHSISSQPTAGDATVKHPASTLAAFTVPADGAFGPDTCQNGFVWRQADASDHVCVSVDPRATTAQENSLAAIRRRPQRRIWPEQLPRAGPSGGRPSSATPPA